MLRLQAYDKGPLFRLFKKMIEKKNEKFEVVQLNNYHLRSLESSILVM